ncbi:hypothetical protein VP01_2682g3 [Puccinia sorghi]|uniref:Uncharacterized protein n=1 Tax=Puccinia sorghi TaxID=27349 RepID=A0A0L6V4K4_9BASI|nr:hypothetical protein VP01_2682g3 [Puccinia sorghi]
MAPRISLGIKVIQIPSCSVVTNCQGLPEISPAAMFSSESCVMDSFLRHVQSQHSQAGRDQLSNLSMRMKAHLRHKGLIKYITKPPVPLSGAAANALSTQRE